MNSKVGDRVRIRQCPYVSALHRGQELTGRVVQVGPPDQANMRAVVMDVEFVGTPKGGIWRPMPVGGGAWVRDEDLEVLTDG